MEKKLLGDRIERVLATMRADKIATAVARVTGKPCNCKHRKDKINELHLEFRRRQAARAAGNETVD